MLTKLIISACLVSIGVFLLVGEGHAAIYKYTDKDGTIGFATDLQSVPAPYRSAAKIVSGEAEQDSRTPDKDKAEAKSRQAMTSEAGRKDEAPVAAPEPLGKGQPETRSTGSRFLLSAIIVVSAVFPIIILGVAAADHKKVVLVGRIVILWGLAVYLLWVHAGDVVHVFKRIWHSVENVQNDSANRGKNAARAIKKMDALINQADREMSSESADTEREKNK
jgi:hypothetical protein